MSKPKVRKISFSIPITKINKSDGLFSVQNTGEMTVTAKALISGSLEDLPLDLAEAGEVKIILESVLYKDTDILPVLQTPDFRTALASITRAAFNNLSSILNG